jgi:hypothetical protein
MTHLERLDPHDRPTVAEQAAEAASHGACEECGESPCACDEEPLCSACGERHDPRFIRECIHYLCQQRDTARALVKSLQGEER